MDAAPETREPKQPARRWWLRMIVASAALVAVLLGVYFLTPVVPLHYYAWRYRRRHDGGWDLPGLAEKLLEMRASSAQVTGLLGPPVSERRRPDGKLVLFYDVRVVFHKGMHGMDLVFDEDRLVEVTRVIGPDLSPLMTPPFPEPELDLEFADDKK